jgi:hypothetical protein
MRSLGATKKGAKKKDSSKGEVYKITITIWDGWPKDMHEQDIVGITDKTKENEYHIECIDMGETLAHELGHVFEDIYGIDEEEEIPYAFEDLITAKSREVRRKQRSFSHDIGSK